MRAISRAVYRGLLRLHPGGFAESFGAEMLQVFDDAVETHGEMWLLGDLAVSAARQRLLREDKAEILPTQFCLLSGSYPVIKPPHLTTAKLSLALVLTLLSFSIFPAKNPWQVHRSFGELVRQEVGNAPIDHR